MKIRRDFVSNSSSSSFMIVGKEFSEDDIFQISERLGIASDDDCDIWNVVDEIASRYDISYERGIDNYYGEWCFGLHYGDMRESETKSEFEKRISDKLSEMAGREIKATAIIDGGRDC